LSNTSIESGFHSSSEVDSVLTLDVNIVSKGSISFNYALFNEIGSADDSILDGLQFFINDQLQSDRKVPYHPQPGVWQRATFDLELDGDESRYLFAWVYHQPFGSRGHDRIVLSDLSIVGHSKGAVTITQPCLRGTYSKGNATTCSLCPEGTEGRSLGLTECTACKEGTFAENEGTAECEPCGKGTTSFPNRTAVMLGNASSQLMAWSSI